MRQYSQKNEAMFSRKLHPSAMSYSAGRQVIGFPSNVRGLRILDIGSGESDCVRYLSESGAVAVGVDMRYRSLQSLKTQVDQVVDGQSRKIAERYGPDAAAQFRSGTEANRRSFWSHIKSGRYASALAGSLPFEDKTFDFIYSINCIAKGLDEEELLFAQAVAESFRVLKCGGDIQLWPYLGNNPSPNGRNQRRVLAEYNHSIERINAPIDYPLRVRIKKS